MNDLYLIYVKDCGENFRKERLYEFIFSTKPDEATGVNWHLTCKYGGVEPPADEFIDFVLKVEIPESEFTLELLENSSEFTYFDGVYNIVALAWEYIEDYKVFNFDKKLTVFKYRDSLENIKEILEDKEINFLEY
jgi:hypothetical protein